MSREAGESSSRARTDLRVRRTAPVPDQAEPPWNRASACRFRRSSVGRSCRTGRAANLANVSSLTRPRPLRFGTLGPSIRKRARFARHPGRIAAFERPCDSARVFVGFRLSGAWFSRLALLRSREPRRAPCRGAASVKRPRKYHSTQRQACRPLARPGRRRDDDHRRRHARASRARRAHRLAHPARDDPVGKRDDEPRDRRSRTRPARRSRRPRVRRLGHLPRRRATRRAQHARGARARAPRRSSSEELARIKPMRGVFYPEYVKRLHGTHVKTGPSQGRHGRAAPRRHPHAS